MLYPAELSTHVEIF